MKLTEEQRHKAQSKLEDSFVEAIENSPRGLTLEEVRECFSTAIMIIWPPPNKVKEVQQ